MAHAVHRTVLLALSTAAHHLFFRGIARFAKEHGWHLVADMAYSGKVPVGWRGDGIITYLGHRQDLVDFVYHAAMPRVDLDLTRDDVDIPRVAGDHQAIGRLAAEHFLERGFRHFVWVPFSDDRCNRERYDGFAAVLADAGFTCQVVSRESAAAAPGARDLWSRRRTRLLTQIARLPHPLGIFCYNDCVAADLIDACTHAGMLIPERIAVLGVNNDPLISECISVPLSSIVHDLEGLAYQGAALLDRLMRGGRPPVKILRIPPKGVVTRASTDILAVEDPQVAAALRHIRSHFRDPQLSVDAVVDVVACSRRVLEKAFRLQLRRSIHDEIARLRLDQVRQLLATTDIPVRRIAAMNGFTRSNHLHRAFQAAERMTPLQWRQLHATAP